MSQRLVACPVCGETKDFHRVFTASGDRGVPFIAKRHPVVLCKSCGLCFLNPQHTKEDYDRYYAHHDRPAGREVSREGFRPGSLRKEYDRLRISFLERYVTGKDAAIVDIGSGYGFFLEELRLRGYQNLQGIEPSGEAAAVSQKLFPFHITHAALGDAHLPEKKFDVAMLIAVIEHFTNPVATMRDIYRLLKPGGLFYINTPDLRGLATRHGSGRQKFFKFVHTFYFTEKSLSNALRQAGFEIVGSQTLAPDLRHSTLLTPENFALGELNIIARRPVRQLPAQAPIESEDVSELLRFLRNRFWQDAPYRLAARGFEILRHRAVIGSAVRRIQNYFKNRARRPLADRKW